jgi:hypothetical protein
VEVEPTRVYEAKDAEAFLTGSGLDVETFKEQIDGKFMSAFIRATKPSSLKQAVALPQKEKSCCGPDCCS